MKKNTTTPTVLKPADVDSQRDRQPSKYAPVLEALNKLDKGGAVQVPLAGKKYEVMINRLSGVLREALLRDRVKPPAGCRFGLRRGKGSVLIVALPVKGK